MILVGLPILFLLSRVFTILSTGIWKGEKENYRGCNHCEDEFMITTIIFYFLTTEWIKTSLKITPLLIAERSSYSVLYTLEPSFFLSSSSYGSFPKGVTCTIFSCRFSVRNWICLISNGSHEHLSMKPGYGSIFAQSWKRNISNILKFFPHNPTTLALDNSHEETEFFVFYFILCFSL